MAEAEESRNDDDVDEAIVGPAEENDGSAPRLEVDGLPESGVIALGDDFKTELYAVKYVRISVHKVPLQKDDEAEEEADIVSLHLPFIL